MTRTEHLLAILIEECGEVSQGTTRALRFGLRDIGPGQESTNAERIMAEYADLLAVVEMLLEDRSLPKHVEIGAMINAKKAKVEKFLEYSSKVGTLQP